jgi:inner membrane protein
MDPLSHAVIAASASAAARPAANASSCPAAMLAAGLAALAPDLDVLIRSSTDPMLTLEYHRQFTHALAFVPVGALVCALVVFRIVRRKLGFGRTYVACLAGYATHPLLDAFTTYGTELLWPFSDVRIAWSTIAVVDFLFTGPVVLLVALAVAKRRARYAQLAAVWAAVYLAFGELQAARATAAGTALAASRGHAPVRVEAIPALFSSLVLWKIVYEHDDRYYVDAVRTGFATSSMAGESAAKLDIVRHFPWLDSTDQQALDVERFRRVAGDLLAVRDDAPNRVVDLRYSLVPNEISGFWAIVLDESAAPDAHVGFVATRENAQRDALRLLDILFE